MGQLSQLVFLASIVASCVSYSPSLETKSGFGLSDSDMSGLPTKFMTKLLASLSPEKLKALFVPIVLTESFSQNRGPSIQAQDKIPCQTYEDIRNYHRVKATDNERYYVITDYTEKYQPVIHIACDESGDSKCKPTNPRIFYGYCCRQHKKTSAMYVIPVPMRLLDVRDGHLYRKDTNAKYENYEIVQKDVLMNSDCSCDQSKNAIGEDYTCPNPNSELWN